MDVRDCRAEPSAKLRGEEGAEWAPVTDESRRRPQRFTGRSADRRVTVSLPFGSQVAPRPAAALSGFSVTGAHAAPSETERPATQVAADPIGATWKAVH